MILNEKLNKLKNKLLFFNIDQKFYKDIISKSKVNFQDKTEIIDGKTISHP